MRFLPKQSQNIFSLQNQPNKPPKPCKLKTLAPTKIQPFANQPNKPLKNNPILKYHTISDLVYSYTLVRIEEGQKISVLLAKIMLYNLVTVLQYIRRACNNILKKGYNTCESLDGKAQLLVADKCRDK